MVKNEKRKKLLLLVFLGVFVVVIALVASKALHMELPKENNINSQMQDATQSGLQLSEIELEMNQGGIIEQLTLTHNGKDVTQEAFWYSDDSSIALVANKEPIKGQVSSPGVGETVVRAVYNEENVEAQVKVVKPGMSVECNVPHEAKVGEEVRITAYYTEIGVPYYSYEWTGDEGLDSNEAIVEKTYETPGIKKIYYRTVDMAGNEAELDCEINITE